jgi:hypothetical protein
LCGERIERLVLNTRHNTALHHLPWLDLEADCCRPMTVNQQQVLAPALVCSSAAAPVQLASTCASVSAALVSVFSVETSFSKT